MPVTIDEDALNAISALQRPGKPDLLERIVTLFQSESPKSIESMQEGLDSFDLEAVRVAAHTLKSSSAYVGAMDLSAQCKDLEKAAHDQNLPACIALGDSIDDLFRESCNALDARMSKAALEDAGFDVVQAADGLQAIESFKEHEPDLIIMDAVMPVMDGFDAISAIRKLSNGEHVPILMITGLDDLDSITRAYDEGATDFLTKPINFFILPHRVQYMMRSKMTADELRSSQAKLDNAQRLARLGNWEWCLSTGELSHR